MGVSIPMAHNLQPLSMFQPYDRVTLTHDRRATGIMVHILTPATALVSFAVRGKNARKMCLVLVDELVLLEPTTQAARTTTSSLQRAA